MIVETLHVYIPTFIQVFIQYYDKVLILIVQPVSIIQV